MPKKYASAQIIHRDILDKIAMWGRCVRIQRVRQHLRAEDLCQRIFISRPTLRRLEKGDPGIPAATYLSALNVLGLLHEAAPDLDPVLHAGDPVARARDTWGNDDF